LKWFKELLDLDHAAGVSDGLQGLTGSPTYALVLACRRWAYSAGLASGALQRQKIVGDLRSEALDLAAAADGIIAAGIIAAADPTEGTV